MLSRRAKSAAENLQVTPKDIAIDSARTRAAFFTRIFYTVRLNIANPERVPIPVRQAFFKVFLQDAEVSRIESNTPFTIPANGNRDIAFNATINSAAVIGMLRQFIDEGLKANMYIEGWIDTPVGRIPVQFNQSVGIGAPATGRRAVNGTSFTIKNLKRGQLFRVKNSRKTYVRDAYIRSANKYMATNYNDVSDSRLFKPNTPVDTDFIF